MPGKIEGSVRALEGTDLGALEISVVDVPGVAPAKVDEEGRFLLENVPAGTRTVQQTGISMDLYLGPAEDVEVPSGGVASLVMDVTTLTMVAIEVDVELDGLPLPGAELRLVRESTWPRRVLYDKTESHEIYLGNTDQDGHASGRGRLLGPMIPVLHLDGWNVLHHPTRRIDLNKPDPIRTTVRFESAAAVVSLPASTVIPENGSIDIEIERTADSRIRSAVTISIVDGEVIEAHGVEHGSGTTSGPWTIRRLPPGDVTIHAKVYDIAVSPHGWRGGRQPPTSPPVATFKGTGTLRAGAEDRVTLQ